jgi:carotenoid cleavage dioxygenase-like enzyme
VAVIANGRGESKTDQMRWKSAAGAGLGPGREHLSYFIPETDIEGTLPPDLKGTFLRNVTNTESLPPSLPPSLSCFLYRRTYVPFAQGPGNSQVYGVPLVHPIDGDGLVCALTFTGGSEAKRGVHLNCRFVESAHRALERSAQRMLFRGQMGTNPAGLKPIVCSNCSALELNPVVCMWVCFVAGVMDSTFHLLGGMVSRARNRPHFAAAATAAPDTAEESGAATASTSAPPPNTDTGSGVWSSDYILFRNPSNTNVFFWGGRLLSCYETHLPIALDPHTLQTLGADDLSGALTLGAMAAHYRYFPLALCFGVLLRADAVV